MIDGIDNSMNPTYCDASDSDPDGSSATTTPPGMPRYAAYYPQLSGPVPTGSGAFDLPFNWAGIDEALPLAFGDRLYEAAGTLPAYDSKTWTVAEYQAVLGSTLGAIDVQEIGIIRNLDFRVRTNPAVVGKTLTEVANGVPLFLVDSPDPALIPYGYDKDGTFIYLAPDR